jgi:hypothetical protein
MCIIIGDFSHGLGRKQCAVDIADGDQDLAVKRSRSEIFLDGI